MDTMKMSTRKITAADRKIRLFLNLDRLEFTIDESHSLLRASRKLDRWAEGEANGEIERNEETNLPYRRSIRITDSEANALKRVAKIIEARNARNPSCDALSYYHQTDPRGCAIYLLSPSLIEKAKASGYTVDMVYSQGVAVCL
jgi:hypothetical protein